jgi:hypothetical protein
MKENGILLYSRNFLKQQFDDNLILGFFSSIANFSREALESTLKNMDLGEYKLVIISMTEEKILVAAIASREDNAVLVNNILKNIAQDFIDSFSPEYNQEMINRENVDKVVDNNLKGKVLLSSKLLFLIAWLIVVPLSYLLIYLSILFTSALFQLFDLNKIIISRIDIFTIFIPMMVLLALFNLTILFLPPNLILGFLIVNKKISILCSFIFIPIIIVLYYYSAEPLFAYIIIAYLPLIVITSPIINYIGYKFQRKKFLIK